MDIKSNLSSVWSKATTIFADHGEGVYLYDTDGNRFLDFTSGIGVTNTGHCHPRIVEAIQKQAEQLIFGQLNIVYHKPVLELTQALRSILPSALDTFFFSNSGAEAVEGAVKLAKQATGRQNVIVFHGSFHGRTHLTMAMTTSKTVYRTHYQPLVPGIIVSPYPYAFYYGWSEEETLEFALQELHRVLKSQTAPDETAAIIVEPVLGEGGYVVPPKGFLKALRSVCDEHGIMLIADEIQSGFGRTGKFFAIEHESVVPDIMTLAKGMASGMPLSGIAYKKELSKKWITGTHGGTFGGNPLACASGVATIGVLKEEKLVENAQIRGEQLLTGLRELQQDYESIGDVRGLGLMVATEFTSEGKPDAETAKAVNKEAAKNGLLLLSCGTFSNVIRWIPPLIVEENHIAEALDIFKRSLDTVLS
jgi:4-aminobutyrate aminotransferase